ncbi:MAG: DNA-binding protein WhiA [Bacillota bacterium]|nr:DNA-binding protein WhiA [Candidatus Fermentithermobacillaceae bacterium]
MRDRKGTFSRAVKEELARVKTRDRREAYWEILALRRYLKRPKDLKHGEGVPVEPFLMRRRIYLMKQWGAREAPESLPPAPSSVLSSNSSCRRAFLRGAFLARGSISSPVRNHHLEIALPTSKDGLLVSSLLGKEGLKSGLVRRRSSHVAYLKDADEIAEFLRMTGAFQAVMDYEDIRARKSLKSSVLRVVNMDRANVSRAVEASIKQLRDIRTIDEELGLSHLPAALKELARLRLENPDLTMEELGQLLVPAASKSAVNHRFRRIAQIAEGLRKQSGGEPESPA